MKTTIYSDKLCDQKVTLPISADGSISVWFAEHELRFATQSASAEATILFQGEESISKAKVITFLENNKTVVILSSTPREAFDVFARQLVWVEAAGGVVENEQGEVVMIRRNRRWDLPKGHRENGESYAECAAREAEEETGVEVREVSDLLTTTLHAYNLYGRWELKLTAWYAMRAERNCLSPQSEEGIVDAEWVGREALTERLKSTFPTIKAVFAAFDK